MIKAIGTEPKKNYGGWVNAHTSYNYWKSISDYERSKKKKTFEPFINLTIKKLPC